MIKHKLILFKSMILIIWIGLFTLAIASNSEHDIKAAGAKVNILSGDANNIYAAGARVTIEGKAKESIYVAGALVDIDSETDGDLYVAGSQVSVKGKIIGKARIAGADIKIDAQIGEVLNAAAASIEIVRSAKLAAKTSLAAALIKFGGTANGSLNLYADEIVFTGHASGPVLIEGRKVQLDESAVIGGNLTIRSKEKAIISSNAKITGVLTQVGLEDSEFFNEYEGDSDGGGFLLLLSASIFLLGLILILFARGFVEQSISYFRTHPGRSILWGLAVFVGIPIFAILTMVTVIGIPIGVSTLLLLPFLLVLGFTITTLGVSDRILNKSSESKKNVQRLLLLAAGVITLALVGFIPLIGGLLIWLALLFGLGAASATLGNRLSRNSIEIS